MKLPSFYKPQRCVKSITRPIAIDIKLKVIGDMLIELPFVKKMNKRRIARRHSNRQAEVSEQYATL